MRYFLICVAAFMLLAVPAMADDTTNVQVNCIGYRYLDITGADLSITLDEYTEFGNGLALGNIEYTLYSNTSWKIMGDISPLTGTDTWAFNTYVRGVAMDGQVAISTDAGSFGYGTGQLWAATVDVPWTTAPATYNGKLVFTISAL